MTSAATPRPAAVRVGEQLVSRLVAASARRRDDRPEHLAFPDTLPSSAWCTAPELTGLWGTAQWEELDPTGQRRVSFWEAVNFFSLNIHGERALISGLASRLYRSQTMSIAPYLHVFLEEENRHSQAFGTFCLRYGAKVYPSRTVAFGPIAVESPEPGLDDFIFFARVLLFEEIADYHNRQMQHDHRLHPIACAINAMHHRDESRHLQFGRQLVRSLWQTYADQWPGPVREEVRRYLLDYLRTAWREYYNPAVYGDAGIADMIGVADAAWVHPAQVARRERACVGILGYLADAGVLEGVPAGVTR